jgi:hypothetical protein
VVVGREGRKVYGIGGKTAFRLAVPHSTHSTPLGVPSQRLWRVGGFDEQLRFDRN